MPYPYPFWRTPGFNGDASPPPRGLLDLRDQKPRGLLELLELSQTHRVFDPLEHDRPHGLLALLERGTAVRSGGGFRDAFVPRWVDDPALRDAAKNEPWPVLSPGGPATDLYGWPQAGTTAEPTTQFPPMLEPGRADDDEPYARAVDEANLRFPQFVNAPMQQHHVFPVFLGGPMNGPTVPLPRAYHQVITNAFRRAHEYGSGPPPPARAQAIMREVYARYPLPW